MPEDNTPYEHQEYPKVLYKSGQSLTVESAEDEAKAVKGGWKNVADRAPEDIPTA